MSKPHVVGSVLAVFFLLPACSGSLLDDKEELLSALRKTEPLARSYTYQEKVEGHTRTVKGTFEDDLRYSVVSGEDGLGIIQMVVSDDTLAVKVFDPAKVPALNKPSQNPAMLASLAALRKGEWVIDPAAAPPLETLGTGQGVVEVGKDPIADSLNALQYLNVAISESAGVREWQKQDIEAAYRLGEDTFDPPDPSIGIKRFDLIRIPIPRATGGGAQDPRTFHFRKVAIYVKQGRIIRITEEVEWEHHIEIQRAKKDKKPKYLLELLTRLREGKIEIPITPRRMNLEFSFRDSKVDVPIGLTSSLEGLFVNDEDEEEPAEQPTETASPVA